MMTVAERRKGKGGLVFAVGGALVGWYYGTTREGGRKSNPSLFLSFLPPPPPTPTTLGEKGGIYNPSSPPKTAPPGCLLDLHSSPRVS